MKTQPLVSIGFPVFNGMRYLRDAFACLEAQDYSNLEIIISDNASTDGTYELCREFASRHTFVRLFRNDQNLGASQKMSNTFHSPGRRHGFTSGGHWP